MRRSLFAAVSLTALVAGPAWTQQTITDERTEPIETADADGQGNADSIVIGSGGRVTILGGRGPAVRVNSDHSLTTSANTAIRIDDRDSDGNALNVDGAVGVQLDPGVAGGLNHSGSIVLDDSDDSEDPDGDGETDGAFAQDLNKTGVLVGSVDASFNPVADQSAFTGDVILETGSAVSVQGQNSYGVRTVTDIGGDLIAAGSVTMTGENSRGISVEGDVSGDVQFMTVTAISPGGEGVVVDGDVGGGVRTIGPIQTSGYRTTQRLSEATMSLFENEVEAAERNEIADNLDSGSAFIIGGSIENGVFVSSSGQILAYTGGGAALELRPNANGTGHQTIGEVILPDDFTDTRADDDDEPNALGYAVVNEGIITNSGVFDGKDTTAFLIVGRDDNGILRSVVLGSGGIGNTGTIAATAFDATAVAIQMGRGATADTLHNGGLIQATAALGHEADDFADNDRGEGIAIAIELDEGSQIRQILNEAATITATVVGGGRGAVAILSSDASLDNIRNTGVIGATATSLNSDFTADDIRTIAIDARDNHGGLTILQEQAPADDSGNERPEPSIVGDVLFGDGDDRLELNAGSLSGDVAFGAGSDVLIINNANLDGAISDTDGDLVIDVSEGAITLTGEDALTLRDAIFRSGGELRVAIDGAERTASFVEASGNITFEEGSTLSVSLDNVIGTGRTFEIISAGTLAFAGETETLAATNTSFLYKAALERAVDNDNTLVLTLSLKNADELGMNANQAAAYEEAVAAFEAVETLGAAMAALTTADAFYDAYGQLLPEYAASAIEFALASNDASTGALESRLRNARMAPDDLAGVWVQEFGYFADRSSTALSPGYRGHGVGGAIGLDRPLGPFYAIGVTIVGAASEIEEIDGFDQPMVALTGQLGAYAAMDLGGFDISGSAGLGYDYFETKREIRIGDFSALTEADWSGWHAAASVTAGRDFAFGRWALRPESSLTYMSMFEGGYSETTMGMNAEDVANLALSVDDRNTSVLLGAATVTLARRFGSDVSWWMPSVRAGYRGGITNSGGETMARLGETGDQFTLQAEELSNSGLLAGFGLSAGSDYSTFTFAYDADMRDDFIRHVARLVIRLTF